MVVREQSRFRTVRAGREIKSQGSQPGRVQGGGSLERPIVRPNLRSGSGICEL